MDVRSVGARIEALLAEAERDPRGRARTEELLGLVTDLYGGALARVVELVGPGVARELAADDLIASVLLVHGLHPVSLGQRVEEALQRVRPMLRGHGGDVELVAVDPSAGAVSLRLLGSCDGCPSSAVTLQLAVEQAILDAAPEVERIDVEPPGRAVPVTLGDKPACPVAS
ncbi:MAG: NifU family protein [Acidimicrobiales bacterium]